MQGRLTLSTAQALHVVATPHPLDAMTALWTSLVTPLFQRFLGLLVLYWRDTG